MKRQKRRSGRSMCGSPSDAQSFAATLFGRFVMKEGPGYSSTYVTVKRLGLSVTEMIAGAVLLWMEDVARRGAIPSSCFVVSGERRRQIGRPSDFARAHEDLKDHVVAEWGGLEHDLATNDAHTSFEEEARRLRNLGNLSRVRVTRNE